MASTPPKLIYVDDDLPGITRRGAGRGWAYYDPTGIRIKERAERQRLNAIGLPPAYRDAWFCPADNGHILATGVDDKGRKQYRYHPEFRAMREGEKFDACLAFGELLPLVRKRVEGDLKAGKPTRERALASVIRLLDLGVVRIGNDVYAKSNKSYGATTLRRRHADIKGSTLTLKYRAKSGKDRCVKVTDRGLVRFVKAMQDLPGQRLFQYIDDEGEAHNVGSSEVNAYLCETMGEHFTAKHFRTWHASVLAFDCLVRSPDLLTIKAMMEQVSARLGNTPAIARKSYVHPAIIAQIDEQVAWRSTLKLPRKTRWLSREERGLIALLEISPAASELLAA
ncbi:DNA topoisomerase IB [Altericroceibacterium endophyticum]|uniref:DNA topoisomerase n=1 Tax=Altericroceibacterium endophyticum TaxID=1808508 RepID=A0A6I4T9I8_9SPHN|nr:DNA topoisomerase IB [Altericroceibacterium endophyticum]MXO66821.1 DNA topoisomerase IB [Altericroceibacterium endophyticum]